jgi:hypothetical protein
MYKVSVTYRYNRYRTAESDALYKSDETVQGQAEVLRSRRQQPPALSAVMGPLTR